MLGVSRARLEIYLCIAKNKHCPYLEIQKSGFGECGGVLSAKQYGTGFGLKTISILGFSMPERRKHQPLNRNETNLVYSVVTGCFLYQDNGCSSSFDTVKICIVIPEMHL